ncbi:MAG: hypothetical protein IT169_19325 [Bryobacterales bacterium]|nr:hypothetical protein [Bryobacterales bacterium]
MSCCNPRSKSKWPQSPIFPFLALVFVGALLLGTCSRNETRTADSGSAAGAKQIEELRASAAQIAAQQASMTPVNTEWTFGETVSAVTGYYDGEQLRMIDEQMNMGSHGSASSRFFYTPAGKLFAYEEKKESRSGAAGNNVVTEQSELRLYFADPSGLLSGERTVAGKSAALLGIEEQTVRMHARELEAALTEAHSRKP